MYPRCSIKLNMLFIYRTLVHEIEMIVCPRQLLMPHFQFDFLSSHIKYVALRACQNFVSVAL